MVSFEEVYSGLGVARSVFREEALTIARLVLKFPEEEWSDSGNRDVLFGANGSDKSVHEAVEAMYEVKEKLMGQEKSRVYFTRYRPRTVEGGWHDDREWLLPVHVLALADIDKPVFEYDTGEPAEYLAGIRQSDPEGDVGELTLNAGDVVRVTDPYLTHRGFNPIDNYRYIGIISK